jgi:4-hydroxythreonine-4-phosphate dehydrogenase
MRPASTSARLDEARNAMTNRPAIAVSAGEPAGIGPELIAMLAARHRTRAFPARIVIVGDRALLEARALRIGAAVRYLDYDGASFAPSGGAVEVWHQPVAAPVTPGRLDPTNAHSVLTMLGRACDACTAGIFSALTTAPVQKSVLMDAGIPFSGHTEFFAQRTGTARVVMMLVGGARDAPLRVALVTTHLALGDVPRAVTFAAVAETIAIVGAELAAKFGIASPRVAVCGLNPHAGEGGHLGREEVDVIAPAIAAMRSAGHQVSGPLPADTVFVPDIARRYDAIIAMYHDQGLPVLKAASFGHGVNVTLGLPFIRTSVDHGTALDLAADAKAAAGADAGSLIAAVELAVELAVRAPAEPPA